MIQHEDVLRDQRITWLFTLNGFLFAALAFAWDGVEALVYIFAALGIATALSSWAGLYANALAIRNLRDEKWLATEPPIAVLRALRSRR